MVCVIERVLLWRNLKEFVVHVYVAITHIKRYGRQLFGEVLSCEREACNAHDHYDVAVKMTGTTDIVGHLPRKVSRVCLLFLCRGER